jgi:hypothetical protein
LEYFPKRSQQVAPEGLRLSARPKTGDSIASRAAKTAEFTVPRASKLTIDGKLDDWTGANWTTMEDDKYVFCDNWNTEVTIKIPDDVKPGINNSYIGFTWDGNNNDYRAKYRLEGWSSDETIVTGITPNSPAEKAGLREGDRICYMGEKRIRWSFEVWGIVDNLKRRPGSSLTLKLQRGGLDTHGGPSDLSGKFAFMVDDTNLYFAADVTDDVHHQNMPGPEFWKNDCVQIGIDPVLARTNGYGEQGQEFGFALIDGKPVAYRWAGRRGQPLGVIKDAKASVVREGTKTIYEKCNTWKTNF